MSHLLLSSFNANMCGLSSTQDEASRSRRSMFVPLGMCSVVPGLMRRRLQSCMVWLDLVLTVLSLSVIRWFGLGASMPASGSDLRFSESVLTG